eukprot:10684964-Lingulodinium_polyedra.AAC.1
MTSQARAILAGGLRVPPPLSPDGQTAERSTAGRTEGPGPPAQAAPVPSQRPTAPGLGMYTSSSGSGPTMCKT